MPNGVYAIDLSAENRKTISWLTGGPNIAGMAGPTFGTDGTLYVATAAGPASPAISTPPRGEQRPDPSSIVALDGETLKLKDWFTAPGADFNTSPIVFE